MTAAVLPNAHPEVLALRAEIAAAEADHATSSSNRPRVALFILLEAREAAGAEYGRLGGEASDKRLKIDDLKHKLAAVFQVACDEWQRAISI